MTPPNVLKPRFSRKSLNLIMIVTALLILVLSQWGDNTGAERETPDTADASQPFSLDTMRERYSTLREVPLVVSSDATLAVEHWQSQNGARVYFVQTPEIPMVDVRLVFDAGAARDADMPGLAHLTNDLLLRGTQDDTADDLVRQFESLGVQYSVSAYRDMAMLSIRVLNAPQYLNPAIDLVARVVGRPAFADSDVNQLLGQYRVGLERSMQQPGVVIERAVYERLYPGHPYGSNPGGTEASLARITPADLRRFHQRYYVSHNLVIAIVGAISKGDAARVSDQLTAFLMQGARAQPLPDPVPQATITQHIAFESQQTHIRVAALTIDQNHPDYYALYLGNHILGGSGFSSLLNERIRQAHGLAYSVFSQFQPMRVAGPFYAGLQTETSSADLALEMVKSTIQTFVSEGPTPEQLEQAKQQITSSFALRAANNASILGYLSSIGFYELPMDYLNQFNANIQAVTAAQVKSVLAHYLDAGDLQIFSLGQVPSP